MSDRPDHKNLGRQGPPTSTYGMWPNGEPAVFRDAYDLQCRYELLGIAKPPAEDGRNVEPFARLDDGTTKVCYNCRGTGRSGGKQCTACQGAGAVPAAS